MILQVVLIQRCVLFQASPCQDVVHPRTAQGLYARPCPSHTSLWSEQAVAKIRMGGPRLEMDDSTDCVFHQWSFQAFLNKSEAPP